MGDIADAILDGEFDEISGEYIGPGCGYPRSKHYGSPVYGNSPTKGVVNYLGQISRKEKRTLVKNYSEQKLNLNFEAIGFDKCCAEIQKNFNAFSQYVKNQNKK